MSWTLKHNVEHLLKPVNVATAARSKIKDPYLKHRLAGVKPDQVRRMFGYPFVTAQGAPATERVLTYCCLER